MHLKTKLGMFFLIAMIFSMFSGLGATTNEAQGAAGTAGKLQFGFNSYVPGNSYLIVMKDLSVSGDFNLTFTAGVADEYTFTTGASETRIEYRVTLEAPTTGTECMLTLGDQAGVSLDTIRIQSTEIEDVINRDTLVEIIMLVMVIMLVLGIVLMIFKKMT